MYAIPLEVNSICQAFSLTCGKVTLSCDNLGILSQLCCPKETISCSCKHANLLWVARLSSYISPSRLTLCMSTVAKTPTYSLSLWTTLLSFIQWLMTLPSSIFFLQSPRTSLVCPLIGESWSCSLCDGSKLTSDPHGPVIFSHFCRSTYPATISSLLWLSPG